MTKSPRHRHHENQKRSDGLSSDGDEYDGTSHDGTSHDGTSHSMIERAKLMDADAWDRLVHVYGPMIYAWARKRGASAEDAADVMQEVFQVLTTKLSAFQKRSPKDSFRAWLYTVTRNRVVDLLRKQEKRELAVGGTGAQLLLQEYPEELDQQSEDSQTELLYLRHRALESLSIDFDSRTWQAFYRTAIQGDLPADVATDLGISVWAVYKARSRILQRLKEEFAGML